MEQLTEVDYAMIQMDSARTPSLISTGMIYDQSGVTRQGSLFEDVLEVFRRNLHKSHVFRRKLTGSTMGLDTPYWIEDSDFDLEFHVRQIALPKPGNWKQLCNQMARLHSHQLDMTRPLWEAYVIEGLNSVEGLPADSFAILLKIHHAAIDGVAAAEILNGIHTLNRNEKPKIVEDNWEGEEEPSQRDVWKWAFQHNLQRPKMLVSAIREFLPKAIKFKRAEAENGENDDSQGFKIIMNNEVSAHRVMDALILDLDRVKAVRHLVDGSTINDVIVSIVGGGMRKYLQAKDELPPGPLKTAVPISVRDDRNTDSRGNQVGMMLMEMGSDVDDPVQRLLIVCRSSQHSKDYANAVGTRTMMNISRGLWPVLIGAGFKLVARTARSEDGEMPIHTIVSNVPGPQMPLYLAGAELRGLFGMGPLSDGLGVFHGVMSSNGVIPITFVACRQLMPDPEFYKQCLQEAWDELEKASEEIKKNNKKTSKK